MNALATKLRTSCAPADLRVGDELRWQDGLWHEVIAAPVVLEADINGTPVRYAVPVMSVKGRERNTLAVEAETWLVVRRNVV